MLLELNSDAHIIIKSEAGDSVKDGIIALAPNDDFAMGDPRSTWLLGTIKT